MFYVSNEDFFFLEDEFLALFHHSTVFPKLVGFELRCSLHQGGRRLSAGLAAADTRSEGFLAAEGGCFPHGHHSPSGQHSEEQSHGCLSPSVQLASLVQVREPPRGENIPEGLFGTSAGQVGRRCHPGIPDWNLLQISETPAHSSYCCFIYYFNVCHPLSFSVASYLLVLDPMLRSILGKAQLKSGQLLLNCMNTVDAKCWLENILCWCFIGSGCFLGAEQSGSNWQNYSLARKRKNEIPPLNLHSC